MTDRNAQIEQLIRLNNDGFIDDAAFISAIKKVYEKAYPVGGVGMKSPSSGSPFTASPLGSGIGGSISGTSYKSAGSKLRADYHRNIDPHFNVPVVNGECVTVSGLASPDIYSGSILKPEPKAITVIAYSENRSHVPEHAKQMLEWIDEAWGKKVEEYNKSKPDWDRVVEKDEDGNELIEWRNKEIDESLIKAYQDFINNDVIVEWDDADINGLQHIFNLDISKSEC